MNDHTLDATNRRAFRIRIARYWLVAGWIKVRGYDAVLDEVRDAYHAIDPACSGYHGPDTVVAVEQLHLVTAINKGLSVGEYLETDSLYAWLSQHQRQGGAV